MTEKRFELIPYGDITYGLFDGVKKEYVAEHLPIRFEGICDILNELHEKNKELKKENDILIKQRLGEERLKQEIADYHTSNGRLHRLTNDLIRRLDEFHIDYSDILRELE